MRRLGGLDTANRSPNRQVEQPGSTRRSARNLGGVADWTTISSLATAGGTLILAVATFSSVRSANRAARTAERALQVGLRPVLMPSRLDDPPEKLRWLEGRWVTVPGGRAYVEETDGIIYLAMSLRNVGSGIAVIQGWRASGERPALERPRPDPSEFRNQSRDLYIPSGGSSFWQGALRDQDEERYEQVHAAIIAGDMLVINP